MKNRQRRLLFLIFVTIVICPFLSIVYNASCASGYNSKPGNRLNEKTRKNAGDTEGKEVPQLYTFTDHQPYPGEGVRQRNCYGVHDWVADSAVRLILYDDNYKKLVNEWLFAQKNSDSKDNKAPFKDFAGSGLESEGYTERYKYWTHKDLVIFDSEKTWVRARRYVQFLHGTGTPDWTDNKDETSRYINIEDVLQNEYRPAEAVTSYRTGWKNTRNKHHVYFDFYDFGEYKQIYPSYIGASELAKIASEDAIHFAKIKKDYTDNNGEQVEIKGKWEAVAQCLGAMTHFIADVANPKHAKQGNNTKDASWPGYMAYYGVFTTSDTRWPNGGPSWIEGFDPYAWMQSESLTLAPMSPRKAVLELAQRTYAAIDIDGYGPVTSDDFTKDPNKRPLAAGNPHFPLPVRYADKNDHVEEKKRVQHLVELAAYYSARAMIWTLQRCDLLEDGVPQNTITASLSIIAMKSGYGGIPNTVPASAEKLEQLKVGPPKNILKGNTNGLQLMLVLGVLAPVLALVIIPTTIYYATNEKGVEEIETIPLLKG